ncbi:hypothetical protein SEVIR_3G389501v4 [Setaria viridis]
MQIRGASFAQCVGRNRRRRRGLRPPALRSGTSSRQRMHHPPVPEGVTATSCSLWARPAAAAGELVSMPLRHAPALVSGMDGLYFRSLHRFRELRGSGGRGAGAGEDHAQPGRQRSATCRRRASCSWNPLPPVTEASTPWCASSAAPWTSSRPAATTWQRQTHGFR